MQPINTQTRTENCLDRILSTVVDRHHEPTLLLDGGCRCVWANEAAAALLAPAGGTPVIEATPALREAVAIALSTSNVIPLSLPIPGEERLRMATLSRVTAELVAVYLPRDHAHGRAFRRLREAERVRGAAAKAEFQRLDLLRRQRDRLVSIAREMAEVTREPLREAALRLGVLLQMGEKLQNEHLRAEVSDLTRVISEADDHLAFLLRYGVSETDLIRNEAIDLPALAATVLRRRGIRDTAITIEPMPAILGDRDLTTRIVSRMIGIAARAVGKGASGTEVRARLSATQHDDFVRIALEINGAGDAPARMGDLMVSINRIEEFVSLQRWRIDQVTCTDGGIIIAIEAPLAH